MLAGLKKKGGGDQEVSSRHCWCHLSDVVRRSTDGARRPAADKHGSVLLRSRYKYVITVSQNPQSSVIEPATMSLSRLRLHDDDVVMT